MHSEVRPHAKALPGAMHRWPGLRTLMRALAWWVVVLLGALQVRAAEPELTTFEVLHNDDGVVLSYSVNLDLSRSVDEALSKSVPLHFVAEAEVFRDRWYWRDQRVAHAVRRWRIEFQPLTSSYRVQFDGGLSQRYATRAEAFSAIGASARWKVAEGPQIESGSRHYVEFSYRLDTSQLPRPMQIGIGGQADWSLQVQRSQRFN